MKLTLVHAPSSHHPQDDEKHKKYSKFKITNNKDSVMARFNKGLWYL